VHVLPHWTWHANHTGRVKAVRAYTNAHSVKLTLNGKAVGQKQTVRRLGWAEWNVSYVPGTLTAQGYDATGKVIATDIVQTTGKLTRLRLSIESGSGGSSDVLDADDVASCVRK
jgi:beta-galactosidase